MKDFITLHPINKVSGTINLPGSKSISNRVLLLAAQACGTTRIINLLDSDDVHYMLKALGKLGVSYRLSVNRNYCEIDGLGGSAYINNSLTFFIGNSGTAMRFLTAALCLRNQDIILTGASRMKVRPIGHLVDALRQGGAKIDYVEKENYPPLRLFGGYQGGDITIDGSISSQFISALLMMSPLAPRDTRIHIKGTLLVSKPYIDITLALMQSFGVSVKHDNYQSFYLIGNSTYFSPGDYLVEGDASSATYFLAAAAIRGGTVRVIGTGQNSLQGDIQFANILRRMGATIQWGENYIECTRAVVLSAINIDMNQFPDAAMTLAVIALFASSGSTTLFNIGNWRFKESDRLRAMTNELKKVGALVVEGEDYLCITPPKRFISACIETYDDHRIAMSFSLLALSGISVTILNPKCTYKTFPNFFVQLASISKSAETKLNLLSLHGDKNYNIT